MENWPLFVVMLLGLFLIGVLVVTANLSVKKLVGIAAYFNLSSTFMGMTVISLATSIPEITSHITASAKNIRRQLDFQIGSSIVLVQHWSDVGQQTLSRIGVLLTGRCTSGRYFMWKSMVNDCFHHACAFCLGVDRVYSR